MSTHYYIWTYIYYPQALICRLLRSAASAWERNRRTNLDRNREEVENLRCRPLTLGCLSLGER